MSTSFEKTVKLACKPKAAPPKAKYLDPIIAATWSEDGAVHDVCKALSPRFREPNIIVVFKALIVLHTMIRNGATDNVLSYLSSSDVLKLRNVSAGNWEGYNTPQNLHNYAIYLDTRIRAYRDLKHDAIRVQSESNRDMRNSQAIDEDRATEGGSSRKRSKTLPTTPQVNVQRSKTIAGRKLRIMTVEKGLLRETKIVQKMIDSLVDCRFYLDDLEDPLTTTALRMLVKDLLILFQACNEGVINVLEHYFEMSHIDAEEALAIYRHFCKETEKVVEYLGVAKKLQNLLNVPIPNLRHAPVSLAGSLEEYLNDPNFEQNRIEYRTNKEAADRNAKLGVKDAPKASDKPTPTRAETLPAPSTSSASTSQTPAKSPGSKVMADFFSAIEEEQQSMFNPQTNSPSTAYFQQQSAHNPFAAQMTGMQFGQMPQMQMQPQQTGFLMPQQTAFQVPQQTGTNPFGMFQQPQVQQQMQQQQFQQPQPQQQQLQQSQPSFQSFLQPQQTSFLQPQTTGANPFRQSMLFPQSTGMSPFGQSSGGMLQQQPTSTNPFPMQTQMQTGIAMGAAQQTSSAPGATQPTFNAFASMSNSSAPFAPTAQLPNSNPTSPIARPSTAPHPAQSPSSSNPASVKTHQTGSRNPFGVPAAPAPPPVPKPPTLMELAMGVTQPSQQQQQQSSQSTGLGSGLNTNPAQNTGTMSSIASSFSFNNNWNPNSNSQSPAPSSPPISPTSTNVTNPSFSDTHSIFSSFSSQPTGATTASSASAGAPSISISGPSTPLQPQKTGFSGLKPFKPSSSFGAALLESLPPIPSAPGTPNESPQPTSAQPNGLGGSSPMFSQQTGLGALNAQPTGLGAGNTVGVGLRPQATGLGAGLGAGGANPFRASMYTPTAGAGGGFGANAFSSTPMLGNNPTGMGAFGTGSGFGTGSFGLGAGAAQGAPKQPQNGTASLI